MFHPKLKPLDTSGDLGIPNDFRNPQKMGGVLLAPSSLCNIMVESPFARKPGWVLNGLVKSSCLWDTKQAEKERRSP